MAKLTKSRARIEIGAGSLSYAVDEMVEGKCLGMSIRISASDADPTEDKPASYTLRMSRIEAITAAVKLAEFITRPSDSDRSDIAKLRDLAKLLERKGRAHA